MPEEALVLCSRGFQGEGLGNLQTEWEEGNARYQI